MKHPIAITHNKKQIYVDLLYSLAGSSIAQQPHLAKLVQEVVRQTNVTGPSMYIEQDMQRVIGYDYVVPTTATDHIYYGKIMRDPIYTRFVKNGKPVNSSYLSLVLFCDDDGDYELRDVWIGKQRPARPGSDDANDKSTEFWANHAVAYEGQQLQSRTLTKTCPY
jgi:hypothetical protein